MQLAFVHEIPFFLTSNPKFFLEGLPFGGSNIIIDLPGSWQAFPSAVKKLLNYMALSSMKIKKKR